MTMDAAKVAKSAQEQAVAAWIGYLNQLRIDGLIEALRDQDKNWEAATEELTKALRTIDIEIIERGRGGSDGMHGFIAEVAEVGVSNARRLIVGDNADMTWVNNNGPADLQRQVGDVAVDIQQKFVNSGGRFSLGAITDHLQKYPDFVANGGKYQIPSDHYEKVKSLFEMSREEAAKLSRSGDGPSLKDWERVQEFFKRSKLDIFDLEPSKFSYREVQRGAIDGTMEAERSRIEETDQKLRSQAYQDSLPNLKEGAKATAAAAIIEGGAAFVMAVRAKSKDGKRIRDFGQDDWVEVLGESGKGFAKGGVRGSGVYVLTNFTATSAAVASSIVTASFGIAEQAHLMRSGEIDEIEFIENSEELCLEAAISALSSFVGQSLMPIPVLGAVIGNTAGNVMYQAAKSGLSEYEQELIRAYQEEQRELDEKLDAQYRICVSRINEGVAVYVDLLDRAFSPDAAIAFEGSILLAKELGVPSEQVLDTRAKAVSYFME